MALCDEAATDLVGRLQQAAIGSDAVIAGPFGPRPLIYADHTASGRALDFVEAALLRHALPVYGNTHSETSFTGAQTTRFREEARATIRRAVGADDRHAVIFTGSGATAAIHKLAAAIGLRGPAATAPRDAVVFVGPYEHHSNELVWRESAATPVRIPLDENGRLCFAALSAALERHAGAGLKIGSFSAASNVSGVITDMRALAHLLHAHGAWFFADYAAGGPYLEVDMAESAPGAQDQCDAIFVSPHKFIGGPGASGVLVADRRLFDNAVPTVPGGGTVSYVNAIEQRYIADIEHREEAGTPAILGDIRAGLAFALKADMGAGRIGAIEDAMVAHVRDAWRGNPAIEVLGPADGPRLPIFSFNIRAGRGYLHPNFVVALLNDLFGIQARGGCSCAGPYGHDLLGIAIETSERFDRLVAAGLGVFKPGWARLNFHFSFDAEMVDYVIAAVDFVARRGAQLLPLYDCDLATGRWRCGGAPETVEGFARLCNWRPEVEAELPLKIPSRAPLADYLTEAEAIAEAAHRAVAAPAEPDARLACPERWFVLATDRAA
jgi:selenocysteine lyase/cysteine desulfurase